MINLYRLQKFTSLPLYSTGNRQFSTINEWMAKTLQPEEKRNKQTIFQLISQRTNQHFLVVNIGQNKTNYNSGSSKNKKEQETCTLG